MSSVIAKQHAFFSIQRIAAIEEVTTSHVKEEIIEIYLVLNGSISVVGKEFHALLESNSLYCTCRSEHVRADVQEGTAGYIIRFSRGLLYSADRELYNAHLPAFNALLLRDEVISVDASFLGEGKKICDMMYQEHQYNSEFSLQILSGFLGIFLLHLIRKSNLFTYVEDQENQHALAHRFNSLLEQKFKTCKRVSDYATLLSVTPGYLNAKIKQATGKPAGSLIRQRLVMEAVRQAKLTGASMKEVAYHLGFNDDAHFSKFFKKAAGANFSDIRKYHFSKTWVM